MTQTIGELSKNDLGPKKDHRKEARSTGDEPVSEEEERSGEHPAENERKRLQGSRGREHRGRSPSPSARRSHSPNSSRRRPEDKTDAMRTLGPVGPGAQKSAADAEQPESGGKHKGGSKTLRLKGVAAVTRLSKISRGKTVDEEHAADSKDEQKLKTESTSGSDKSSPRARRKKAPSFTCSKAAQISVLEEAGWAVSAFEQLELTDKKMLTLLTRKFDEESRSVSPERTQLGGNPACKQQNLLTAWHPDILMF